jgi:hypothetical protein
MLSMRSLISLVGLFLVLAPAAPAEEARVILNRAIAAHGGETRLQRTKKGHLKAEWKGKQWNGIFEEAWEETFDLPARYRRTIDGKANGRPYHRDGAMNGIKGWLREENAAPSDIAANELVPVEQHWHAILPQLLLLSDKDVQLTSLPDETKDGRTLAGIRATSPRAVVDLYFDKSTGLIARARRPLPNFRPGQEQISETIYDDYQTIQGIRYPMRFTVSAGDDFSRTVTFSTVEFLDTIDDSVFAKPETPATEEIPPPASASNDETPARWLIVATLSAGVVVGAMWFLVRASKNRKQETPSR